MHAVDGVVARHYGAYSGLLDGLAEGGEIDFVDSALIGVGTDSVAIELLLVEGEVLDGCHHALFLHAFDIVFGSLGCQVGVFAVVFEVAAAKG